MWIITIGLWIAMGLLMARSWIRYRITIEAINNFLSTFVESIMAIESDDQEMGLVDHYQRLEILIELGIIIATRDPNGEISYYHSDHIGSFVSAGEPRVLLDEIRLRHQIELYGDSLN